MSGTIAKQATEANDAQNIKEPHLGWMIGFMFLVSFVGLFALVPLRKARCFPFLLYSSGTFCKNKLSMMINREACFQVMIVDYKLTYPSGTASAYLINGFHAPQGTKRAM